MNADRRSIFISVPHGTSAGNMLRAGGLLDRLQEFDPVARDRPVVAAGARRGVRPRVRSAGRAARRSAGAQAGQAGGAAADARAGGLPQPRPDRIGAHPHARGARERHHPLGWPQGHHRPAGERAVWRLTLRAVGSPGLASSRRDAVRSVPADVAGVRQSRPGVRRGAADANRAAARRARAWWSTRAGTTSPTSCCRSVTPSAWSSGTTS